MGPELLKEDMMRKIFDLYYEEINKTAGRGDELNFNLALYYKHRGAVLSKMAHDHHTAITSMQLDSLFSKSVEAYRKVSPEYLKEEINVFNQGRQQTKIRRRNLFLYPDHFQKVWTRAFFVNKFYSMHFLNYLFENHLTRELYTRESDVELIYSWLKNYNYTDGTSDTQKEEKNYSHLEAKDFIRIDSILTEFAAPEKLSSMANLPRLLLIHEYLEHGLYDQIEPVYQKLDVDKFDSNLKEQEYNSQALGYFVNSFSYLMNEMAEYLAGQGRLAEANRIITEYTSQNNRMKAYADAARGFHRFPSPSPESIYPYLDSAVTEANRLEDYQFISSDPRIILAYSLSAVGGKNFYDLSQSYVKQLSLNTQTDIVQRWIQGIAQSGNYYQAYSSIPEITILTDRLYLYNLILMEEAFRIARDPDREAFLRKKREGFYLEDFAFEANFF